MASVTYLARQTERDVSHVQATLHGHTGVLNSIGETPRDHGLKLAEHDVRLERLERKVDEGFDQANRNFDTVEKRFDVVQAGIVRITGLLTTQDDQPGEEPS
jgi:hypothetical protein